MTLASSIARVVHAVANPLRWIRAWRRWRSKVRAEAIALEREHGCRCGRIVRGSTVATERRLRAFEVCPVTGCTRRVWANQRRR